jgi:uncharacterized protein
MRSIARSLVTAPIRLYRRVVSPLIPARCRYHPTCSAYALEAVQAHGVLRGGRLAVWRVIRCNPWSPGGIDEVPPVKACLRSSARDTDEALG